MLVPLLSHAMQGGDRVPQAVAADHPHHVVRPPVVVVPQGIDGNDSGMLELPGDLGLAEKTLANLAIVGEALLNLLERDRAMQLIVLGDKDVAHPAAGVQRDHAKPSRLTHRTIDVRLRRRRHIHWRRTIRQRGRRVRMRDGGTLGRVHESIPRGRRARAHPPAGLRTSRERPEFGRPPVRNYKGARVAQSRIPAAKIVEEIGRRRSKTGNVPSAGLERRISLFGADPQIRCDR